MPSQRPVRRFAARWFPLNNSRFALIQRRSFPLAPRYDEPVQLCVVPPGELPGLQWEPPGSRARLAHIRSSAAQATGATFVSGLSFMHQLVSMLGSRLGV